VITVNGKLYRWNGTAYVASVASTDISGQLTAAQIASIAATQVTGQLTSAQIASLDATKVAGQLTAAQIASIAASQVTGQLTDAQVAAVSAAKVTGQLVSTQIADAAITVAKFASGIEPVTNVAGTTVPTTKSTNVITVNGKLYRWDGTTYVASVASTDISGQLTAAQIASIAATQVTGQLTASQIASVASTQITGQLTDAQVVAVSAAKVTGQITGTQITDGAISTAKLSAGAVTANEIAAGTITSANIASGAITTAKLSAGAVTATELAAGSVVAGKIAASAVTATELAAGAVTTAKLSAGAVTAATIASGAVTAGALAANSVTASAIAADAITAGKIAAGAVSASEIAAGAVTASKLYVTDSSNIYPDFDMIDPDFYMSAGTITFTGTTSTPLGQKYLNIGTAGATVYSDWIAVDSGEEFWVEALSWVGTAVSGNSCTVGVQTGTLASTGVVTATRTLAVKNNALGFGATTSLGTLSVTTTTSERRIRFYATNNGTGVDSRTGGWKLRRKNNAELIVDGAITASKVATDAITAVKIAAGAVTADKITVGSLSAINSNLGTITAGSLSINNKFIVDSSGNTTIRSATSGARTEVTNSVIKIFDGSGILRVKIGDLSA
jgi:hypothetical protein